MKLSDQPGRCFHFCHRRLPLPHDVALETHGPGRCGASSAAPPRMPGPAMPNEAIPKYKQRGRRHKRAVLRSAPVRGIPARFPAHGRDCGLP